MFNAQIVVLHTVLISIAGAATLFRRRQPSITREDAFRELFAVLAALYEGASRMKPEWNAQWQARRSEVLPEKYQIGSDLASDAAQDMRFAIRLLQRNRWKSVVSPLFDEIDENAWSEFRDVAANISYALASLSETHMERLYQDEQDWIVGAIEQFDDANRQRARRVDDRPAHQSVAEGVYQPIYAAIHLSDRLLERMRYEATQDR